MILGMISGIRLGQLLTPLNVGWVTIHKQPPENNRRESAVCYSFGVKVATSKII